MGTKTLATCKTGFRTLTKDEIDRRIDLLAEDLAALPGHHEEDYRPRWISASDLVRRVRPFLGMN